jgi:hypothetical protein
MNTKEKLELIWKYLFLIVVAIGIFRFTDSRHASIVKGYLGGHELMFFGDHENKMDDDMDGIEKQIEVRKEVNEDGDTTMTLRVNGEEMDPSTISDHEMMWIEKDDSDDGKKMIKIKKMMGKHKKFRKKEKK